MYKLCKTEQSAKRQNEILQTLSAFMKTMRFEDISVSELCARMHMPRKTFYRYFDSKEGALSALIDQTLHAYAAFSPIPSPTGGRSLLREIEQYFSFWQERRDFLFALDKSDLTNRLIDASMSEVVGDLVDPDKFLPNEDRWMQSRVFYFAISGLTACMLMWFRGGFQESATDMARAACRMLSRPLFPHLKDVGFVEYEM